MEILLWIYPLDVPQIVPLMNNNILHAIIYTDIFFWLFPPFRQYSTKYFHYFLIMALADPIANIIYYFFKLNADYPYAFLNFLLAYVIIVDKKNFTNLLFAVALDIISLAVLVFFKSSFMVNNIVLITYHIIIFYKLLKDFIVITFSSSKLNLFYIFFILFELSLIIKFLFYITVVKTGYLYFYLTSIFELLLAVYFSFYNVNNSKKIELKSI